MSEKIGYKLRRAIYASTNGRCFYCGIPLMPEPECGAPTRDWLIPRHESHMSIDHKVPQRHGGLDRIDNLQASCGRCNSQKSLSSVEEYRFRKGMQNGKLPYQFAGEAAPGVDRDILVVVSPDKLWLLIAHNFKKPKGSRRGRYNPGWRR